MTGRRWDGDLSSVHRERHRPRPAGPLGGVEAHPATDRPGHWQGRPDREGLRPTRAGGGPLRRVRASRRRRRSDGRAGPDRRGGPSDHPTLMGCRSAGIWATAARGSAPHVRRPPPGHRAGLTATSGRVGPSRRAPRTGTADRSGSDRRAGARPTERRRSRCLARPARAPVGRGPPRRDRRGTGRSRRRRPAVSAARGAGCCARARPLWTVQRGGVVRVRRGLRSTSVVANDPCVDEATNETFGLEAEALSERETGMIEARACSSVDRASASGA